jgi:hypothetical protein
VKSWVIAGEAPPATILTHDDHPPGLGTAQSSDSVNAPAEKSVRR